MYSEKWGEHKLYLPEREKEKKQHPTNYVIVSIAVSFSSECGRENQSRGPRPSIDRFPFGPAGSINSNNTVISPPISDGEEKMRPRFRITLFTFFFFWSPSVLLLPFLSHFLYLSKWILIDGISDRIRLCLLHECHSWATWKIKQKKQKNLRARSCVSIPFSPFAWTSSNTQQGNNIQRTRNGFRQRRVIQPAGKKHAV